MKDTTLEGRAKTKNGVARLAFSVLCILLEVVFIVALFTRLNRYAEALNLLTRVLGLIVILNMYASPVTSTIKMPWILLILAFPIMGLGLYLLVGLNGGTAKMRKRYQKIDEQLLPCLPQNRTIQKKLEQILPKAGNISSYIYRNAFYPVYQNTDVTYYDEAAKGLEAQLIDLAKAEHFIFMEYHAIEDAEAWQRIQHVLEERVKAGVEVRVFYDDMGSIGFINTDFIKKMEAVGIRCRVFNPYEAQQTGFIQPYADSPLDDEQVGEEVYISMADKAEKYCWFMTPYLIITDEMAHALTLAAKRGVDVRIITPGIPDKKLVYNVTRSFYHELVKDGVRIYEWTPGFCHAKMSVADDCMATCGTINLDYRSLYHHFENGCFMADCDAVQDIRNDLYETMKECREVTEKYRTGRSAYLRLGQLFMRLFAGLL